MPAILHAWRQFKEHTTYQHERVATLLAKQMEAQSILSDHKREAFLPVEVAKQCKATVNDILRIYTMQANKADEDALCLWNMTPKWHWLYHLGEKSVYLNPRISCCMVDEDFVGQLKVIVAASAQGTAMHRVPEKVAETLRWALHVAA